MASKLLDSFCPIDWLPFNNRDRDVEELLARTFSLGVTYGRLTQLRELERHVPDQADSSIGRIMADLKYKLEEVDMGYQTRTFYSCLTSAHPMSDCRLECLPGHHNAPAMLSIQVPVSILYFCKTCLIWS